MSLNRSNLKKRRSAATVWRMLTEHFPCLGGITRSFMLKTPSLKKKLKALESQVSESEDMKETLHNVLIAAQKSSDEKKEASEKEAELIIKKAELDAERIKSGAEKEVMDLEEERGLKERGLRFRDKDERAFRGAGQVFQISRRSYNVSCGVRGADSFGRIA